MGLGGEERGKGEERGGGRGKGKGGKVRGWVDKL